jgi:hypothetical protein
MDCKIIRAAHAVARVSARLEQEAINDRPGQELPVGSKKINTSQQHDQWKAENKHERSEQR